MKQFLDGFIELENSVKLIVSLLLCIRNAIAEDADYDIILSKWNWGMGGMPLLYFAIVENGLDCNCTLSKIVIFIFICIR